MTISDAMRLSHYLPYSKLGKSGFCLPVFTMGEFDNFYIQIPNEINGTIYGFSVLDVVDYGEIPAFTADLSVPDLSVSIGCPSIFVFFEDENSVCSGTLNQLRPVLERFVELNRDDFVINLQILELIGTDQQIAKARQRVREMLAIKFDSKTARAFYDGSVVRYTLWDCLLRHAPTDDDKKKVLSIRAKLKTINQRGLLNIDEESFDLFEDKSFVGAAIRQANDILYNSIKATFRAVKKDIGLSEIIAARRVEERIALILRSIIHNSDHGKEIIKEYSPSTNFEMLAIGEIRKSRLVHWNKRQVSEMSVARLVRWLHAKIFPIIGGCC